MSSSRAVCCIPADTELSNALLLSLWVALLYKWDRHGARRPQDRLSIFFCQCHSLWKAQDDLAPARPCKQLFNKAPLLVAFAVWNSWQESIPLWHRGHEGAPPKAGILLCLLLFEKGRIFGRTQITFGLMQLRCITEDSNILCPIKPSHAFLMVSSSAA